MEIYIPGIRLVSPNVTFRNASMLSRMRTAKQARKQRADTLLVLQTQKRPKLPVAVTITHHGPSEIDGHDNLSVAAKHVTDAVAEWFGVADKDKRISWRYEQERSSRYAVSILIEMRLTLMSDLEQCKVRLANAVKAARLWKRRATSYHVDILDELRARKGDEWTTGFHDAICGLPLDEKLRESRSYKMGWEDGKCPSVFPSARKKSQ